MPRPKASNLKNHAPHCPLTHQPLPDALWCVRALQRPVEVPRFSGESAEIHPHETPKSLSFSLCDQFSRAACST